MKSKSNKKNIIKQTSKNGFLNIETLEGFIYESSGSYSVDPDGRLMCKVTDSGNDWRVTGFCVIETIKSDRGTPINYINELARF